MLIAVPREIKDTGVIVEDILDALAMVDIPVDNENPKFGQYWGLLEVAAFPPLG